MGFEISLSHKVHYVLLSLVLGLEMVADGIKLVTAIVDMVLVEVIHFIRVIKNLDHVLDLRACLFPLGFPPFRIFKAFPRLFFQSEVIQVGLVDLGVGTVISEGTCVKRLSQINIYLL